MHSTELAYDAMRRTVLSYCMAGAASDRGENFDEEARGVREEAARRERERDALNARYDAVLA
eukprot:1768995-Rhodomonas_salina.2